ncbi:MAG: DNA cytosine methyltransferase [Nitrospirota bacterium]|nr:DNA cytosine methyltransferase [Nitrospirota bacterium]MDE3225149.1 DNA cytosine methyltransferase [Nitrospirota bacterium]MDE3244055.1 DNA cytosine methyltransferase [Nitrospirota bacterium]
MTKPIAIDLFSGCGGLTLGLKQAGFKVLGAIEIDLLAVESFKANHKHVVVWQEDVRKVSAAEVGRKLKLGRDELDLLAGCPPCQGFSTLRTRNGAKKNRDRRNNLVREMLRFVRVLRPKAVMMENVPGLASRKSFRDFRKGLQKFGYKVNWDVKDAAHYGVPQRRKRLILLAGLGFHIDFAVESDQLCTVRNAISRLAKAGHSGDTLHDMPEKRSEKVSRLIRDIPKNGGGRLDLPKERQLSCHKAFDGFKDIYGRIAWQDVAPTITSGCFNPSKGRFLHPEENRAITMREAALLQSFPEKYRFARAAGKQAIASMIGNALPPEFIRRHALEIRKQLNVAKTTE